MRVPFFCPLNGVLAHAFATKGTKKYPQDKGTEEKGNKQKPQDKGNKKGQQKYPQDKGTKEKAIHKIKVKMYQRKGPQTYLTKHGKLVLKMYNNNLLRLFSDYDSDEHE